jgi:hypothetical protein
MKRSTVVRCGRSIAGVALVALLAACSSTSTQVSDEIAGQVKDKLDLAKEPTVTCPDDAEAGKGERFTCDIELEGGTIPVKVTFTDDSNFTTEVEGAIYAKSKIDAALKASLAKGGVTVKSIDCKGSELVVFEKGSTVTCTATATDGSEAPMEVGLDENDEAKTVGAVYAKEALKAFLTEQLATQDVTVTSLDCGEPELVQAAEDTTIECQGVDSTGTEATITVGLGQDGTASIEDIATS